MAASYRWLTWRTGVLALLGLSLGAYFQLGAYKIMRWTAYWYPLYLEQRIEALQSRPNKMEHVMFVMADHFEPGYKEAEALTRTTAWMESFEQVALNQRDSYGNPFRYSWFYPYDQPHASVIERINEAVFAGLGEIELHWHHKPSNNSDFPGQLEEAVRWFNLFGAMVSSHSPGQVQFAFIHGNWALDGSEARCGVTRELGILKQKGCYADLTFSTIGTSAQPRKKINSLYYVVDDDQPRSYEQGVDAAAGVRPDPRALLLIQGPLARPSISSRPRSP